MTRSIDNVSNNAVTVFVAVDLDGFSCQVVTGLLVWGQKIGIRSLLQIGNGLERHLTSCVSSQTGSYF